VDFLSDGGIGTMTPMSDLLNNPARKIGETTRDRRRRYRALAKECRMKAAKTTDLAARPTLIQFAQLCEILAEGIETRLRDNAPPISS
jgi:hypothetical protein